MLWSISHPCPACMDSANPDRLQLGTDYPTRRCRRYRDSVVVRRDRSIIRRYGAMITNGRIDVESHLSTEDTE